MDLIMPKRKAPELDPKEQFKRFQETAKAVGVDQRGSDTAERAFAKIAAGVKTAKKPQTDKR